MDDLRFGRLIRVLRRRAGMRQRDLAARAAVSPSSIVRVEAGRAGGMRLESLRRVGAVLGVRVERDARWRGGDEDRLLDAGHAAVVEVVVQRLRAAGWATMLEFTFNHFGERGSVDVLAWHAASSSLLLVEVKTRLLDLQNLVARLDAKARVVPRLAREQHGWHAFAVGRLVVAADNSHNRRVVAAHPALFASALPDRTVAVRRWIRAPGTSLAGLCFLSGIPSVAPRQRVTVPRPR